MKRLLPILILCLMAAHAEAQVGEPRRDVAVGVTVGMTMNTVSFDPAVAQTMKMSPMFGVAVRYNCEKYFSALCGVQAEVNVLNLGWKEDFAESANPRYYYSRSMKYISVPLMARMAWGREKKGLMGFLLAGPQIGFCLSEKETVCAELQTVNSSLTTARSSQYGKAAENKFDYGICAGAGVEINTRRIGHFTLDARYYLGLADIFNNGKADYFGRSANTTISVKFTYFFDVLKTK